MAHPIPATGRYCVIGAGPAGLAVGRHLAERNIPFEVFERWRDVGGLWDRDAPTSTVYRSAHLITSKWATEFPEFPMPRHFPDFPDHRLVLDYLHDYARTYDLYPHIRFGCEVAWAEATQHGWTIRRADGVEQDFAGIIVANGHHWDPAWPDTIPGEYDGQMIHSAAYDTPEEFSGRTVLVVGLGNSASDIAVDTANAGARTLLSVRGGNHIVPKYIMGKPVDQLTTGLGERLADRMPIAVRERIEGRVVRQFTGPPERFDLPRPPHGLYQRQPLVSSLLPYHIGHGDILVKPEIASLDDRRVFFADDSAEVVDVIIWCTGFRISFPFFDAKYHLYWDGDHPELYLNMFHPERDDIFFVGLVDALGGWGVLDRQGELIARYIRAQQQGSAAVESLQRAKIQPRKVDKNANGDDSARNWLFKTYKYTHELDRHLRQLRRAES